MGSFPDRPEQRFRLQQPLLGLMTLSNIDPGRDYVLYSSVTSDEHGVGKRNPPALPGLAGPLVFKRRRSFGGEQSPKPGTAAGFALLANENIPEDLTLEFVLAISGHLFASPVAADHACF